MSVDLADGIWDFAWDLFRCMDQNTGNANILLSPISIMAALSMTLIGAKGKTAAEFLKVLYLTGLTNSIEDSNKIDQQVNHDLHMKIGNTLKQATDTDLIRMANRIYCDQKFSIAKSFLSLSHEAYNSDVKKVDFRNNPGEAVQDINSWVSKVTNRMIPKLVSEGSVHGSTKMVLIDAVYFKGNWQIQFDSKNTQVQKFYAPSSEIDVPMMSLKTEMLYHSNEDKSNSDIPSYKAVALPFTKTNEANTALSFVVILPDDMTKFKQSMVSQAKQGSLSNGLWIKGILSKLFKNHKTEVYFKLPKFKLAPEGGSIKSCLQTLGLQDVFTASADFTGFTDSTNGLYIDDVIHKTIMKVNEQGAEAAAATGDVHNVIRPLPPQRIIEVTVNKPAFVIITDDNTSTPIFFGQLNQPQPYE